MSTAPYNLLLDLGNSRLKWAVSAANLWQVQAAPYAQGLTALLQTEWAQLAAPSRILLCSVAAEARVEELRDWVRRHWDRELELVLAQHEQLGVTNSYSVPQQLGSDRWAALLAARQLLHPVGVWAVCVVDCGTAVTLDLLNAEGEFTGGAIFPGLSLLRTALAQGTESITASTSESTDVAAIPARNTADAVAAGTVTGLCGAIERIIASYRARLDRPDDSASASLQVILTGGDAPLLLPLLSGIDQHVPDLVLRGLALLAEEAP